MTVLTGTRVATVAFALLLVGPAAVGIHAQEPRRLAQSDSVPLDLATALASVGGLGGDPQILVGSLPGWIANRIELPSNGRVLGAAFFASSLVGIVSVATPPEQVIADFKEGLSKHGWKAPPPQPSYGGGFRPPPVNGDGVTTRLMLCGDQQTIIASAARRRGANSELVIRVTPSTMGYGSCNPPPLPPGMPRTMMPTLFNPAGTSDPRLNGGMNGECASAVGSWSGQSGAVRTPMPAESLLEHYARQLQDSGWRATSDKVSIVGRSWTRPDSAGAPYEVSITVTTSNRDSTCRDLALQLRPLKKP